MISIIIPTHNQLPFTRLCLRYIKEFTEEPYEVIVVDNGSTDGTVPFLQGYPGLQLLTFPYNRGFAAAANAGMRAARGRYLVLLNNDIVVTPAWLKNLSLVLDCRPDAGMALPATNLTYGPQLMQVYYRSLKAMFSYARRYNHSNASRWQEVLRLPDYCLIIRREMMEKIGYLDEQFSPGYFEDDDYAYRARQSGFKLIFAADTFVHHFSGVTTSTVSQAASMGTDNRRRFQQKWGLDPLDFFQLSLRILDPLPYGLVFSWGGHYYLFQDGLLRLVSPWHPMLGAFQERIPSINFDLQQLYSFGPPFAESQYLDGILITPAGKEKELYLMHNKCRRPVKDPVLRKFLLLSSPLVLRQELFACLPEGPEFVLSPQYELPGGLLLRCGADYYVTSEQLLRPLGRDAAQYWGYAPAKALPLEQRSLDAYACGPPIPIHPGIHLDFPLLPRVISEASDQNRRLAAQLNLEYKGGF